MAQVPPTFLPAALLFLLMLTLFQGLLLSNQKLPRPPVGCHRVLWSPLTLGPSLSVGPSLLAPQTMLPRVTRVPCPLRPVHQEEEPLHTPGTLEKPRDVSAVLSLPPFPSDPRSEPPPASLPPLCSDPTLPAPSRRRIPTRPFQTRRVPNATSRQYTLEQPRQPSSPNPDCVVVWQSPPGQEAPAPHSAARSRLTLGVRASQPHPH